MRKEAGASLAKVRAGKVRGCGGGGRVIGGSEWEGKGVVDLELMLCGCERKGCRLKECSLKQLANGKFYRND